MMRVKMLLLFVALLLLTACGVAGEPAEQSPTPSPTPVSVPRPKPTPTAASTPYPTPTPPPAPEPAEPLPDILPVPGFEVESIWRAEGFEAYGQALLLLGAE